MTHPCPICGLVYDDTYRWTFCPHDQFEMNCTTMRSDGAVKVCRSIEEQDAFLAGVTDDRQRREKPTASGRDGRAVIGNGVVPPRAALAWEVLG